MNRLQKELYQIFLHLNVHPNNQLHAEKWGGHYSLFVALLDPLVTQCYKHARKFLHESRCYGKWGWKAKEAVCPQQTITHWKVRWLACSYALLVTQHYKWTTETSLQWIQVTSEEKRDKASGKPHHKSKPCVVSKKNYRTVWWLTIKIWTYV